MAVAGLLARLNCREYKNWLKAGQCLLMLQSPLQGYIDREMRAFHRELASRITAPSPGRRCQCRAAGKQFQPGCPVCAQWKELILSHHNYRNGDIHWGNSNPSLWPTHYWEVAKVYMPRGQDKVGGLRQCDAAALLNLINTCDYFRGPNLSRVREVIKCRNELMHSSDMKVSSPWLKGFGQKMQDLIAEFTHIPGLVREGEQMQKVLLLDWSVEDLDKSELDGPRVVVRSANICPPGPIYQSMGYSAASSFSPAEIEILMIQQLIQELYLEIEEQGSLTKQNEDKVLNIENFLSLNVDLRFVLQEDLEKLESVRKNHVPLNAKGWIHTQELAVFMANVKKSRHFSHGQQWLTRSCHSFCCTLPLQNPFWSLVLGFLGKYIFYISPCS
ncbi:uncharacterized protein CXorf38 homolog isoform X2 [Dendropsophus ebraccatus]|uniref:uncharacterized protein CXorf38 homolog isoform X2 n=1 Tax=Dendropsophus ebraccatus TaxID=150705 RepID=UPI00383179B4